MNLGAREDEEMKQDELGRSVLEQRKLELEQRERDDMRDREATGREKICTSFGHMWSAGFHTIKIRARIRCLQCMFHLDCVSSTFRVKEIDRPSKESACSFSRG